MNSLPPTGTVRQPRDRRFKSRELEDLENYHVNEPYQQTASISKNTKFDSQSNAYKFSILIVQIGPFIR
jgi:hypothetical protein